MKRTLSLGLVLSLLSIGGPALAAYDPLQVPGGNSSSDGQVGGPRDASVVYGPQCNGMIDNTRDHVLTVTQAGVVTIDVQSSADATLVVAGPGGVFCNDDRNDDNTNPMISQHLAPGEYEVYIGAYSESDQLAPYTISANAGGGGGYHGGGGYSGGGMGGGNWTDTGTYGELTVPGNSRANGQAGGPRDAASLYGGACVGNIDNTPDHWLNVNSAGTVTLDVQVPGGQDTSLVVVGPGGVFCNDDRAEGNYSPQIVQQMAPGRYEVYIGAYDESASLANYTITATMGGGGGGGGRRSQSQMGGNWTDAGTYGDLTAPGNFRASGQTGGPRDASQVYGPHCNGMIDNTRDHLLTVTSPSTVTLDVQSNSDATLVIAGPGGVFCNDDRDENNRNPMISQYLAPGQYEVYVGAYGESDQLGEYTITSTSR